jgi:hypothetical protein
LHEFDFLGSIAENNTFYKISSIELSILMPSSWMNPNFRTPAWTGTLSEPSAMGR